MKIVCGLVCLLLVAFCVSRAEDEVVSLPDYSNSRFLDKASLESLIVALQDMRYPVAVAELFDRLGLKGRDLPEMRVTGGETDTSPARFGNDELIIHLTDPSKGGHRYTLLLWYDPAARKLVGDANLTARVVNYVELLVEDDGTGDSPKGTFLLQSFRYPYDWLERHAHPNSHRDSQKS